MPYMPVYECTNPDCGQVTERNLLTVKKVMFVEMGAGGRTIRSRVTDWLCPACVAKDPDYNREPFKAPGSVRMPAPAAREEVAG